MVGDDLYCGKIRELVGVRNRNGGELDLGDFLDSLRQILFAEWFEYREGVYMVRVICTVAM